MLVVFDCGSRLVVFRYVVLRLYVRHKADGEPVCRIPRETWRSEIYGSRTLVSVQSFFPFTNGFGRLSAPTLRLDNNAAALLPLDEIRAVAAVISELPQRTAPALNEAH